MYEHSVSQEGTFCAYGGLTRLWICLAQASKCLEYQV